MSCAFYQLTSCLTCLRLAIHDMCSRCARNWLALCAHVTFEPATRHRAQLNNVGSTVSDVVLLFLPKNCARETVFQYLLEHVVLPSMKRLLAGTCSARARRARYCR